MPVITGLLNPVQERTAAFAAFHCKELEFHFKPFSDGQPYRDCFFRHGNGFLTFLDRRFPTAGDWISQYHHDIMAYIIAMFVFMSVIFFILETSDDSGLADT